MSFIKKMIVSLLLIGTCVGAYFYYSQPKIQVIDEQGRTNLYQIIETNDINAVDACIKSGSNVNHADKNGLTPLQFTTQLRIHKNSGEIAQLLINAGADTSIQSESGYSLLQMAVEKRNNFVVAALVNAGLDVNVQDSLDGCTPLHKAIIQACTAAIKDYQGLVSCPCCVEAMFTKSVAIAQKVLSACADTTIKNNHGHTAQDIIEVMFAKVTLGGHTQSDIYYDAQELVDKPEDFDVKITSKFQALKDLFVA